jgi:hypothetical protein
MAVIEGCLHLHTGVFRIGIIAGRHAGAMGNPR